MNIFLKMMAITAFCGVTSVANAQLFDFGKKEEKKTEQSLKKKKQQPEELKVIDNRTFTFRKFALGSEIDVEKLKKDTLPPEGFKRFLTEMPYYEAGEDIRLVDNSGLIVTFLFQEDTPKLVGIDVEDIENMAMVQQLQQMVMQQMGEPTMGYELMKNFDGDKNTIWTDYSTYEFVYRYDIGASSFDFRITQYGAKMKKGKVVHPYDFSAVMNKRREAKLSPAQLNAAENKMENKESEADGVKKEKKDEKSTFYPFVGAQQFDEYMVESKMLRKW